MPKKRVSMGAGEFKARCLQLMDDVQEGTLEVIITKRGTPVARMVAVEPESRPSAFGWLAGKAIEGGANPGTRDE